MLSLQTMEFCPYIYKHWNYGLIYLSKHFNSSPIFIDIGILTSSFETLQLWPYFFKTLEFWPYFDMRWFPDLIL